MATITFSPGLVKTVTDYLTEISIGTTTATLPSSDPATYQSGEVYRTRLFYQRYQNSGGLFNTSG